MMYVLGVGVSSDLIPYHKSTCVSSSKYCVCTRTFLTVNEDKMVNRDSIILCMDVLEAITECIQHISFMVLQDYMVKFGCHAKTEIFSIHLCSANNQ